MPTRRPSHAPQTSSEPGSRADHTALAARQGTKPRSGGGLRLVGLFLGLAGVATVSATTGALLAMSLAAPSLSQRQLTPAEKAVFNKNGTSISQSGLQLPQLTRPVNILLMGIKVVTSDVDDGLTKKYGYQALLNSFEGLSDTMLLLRCDPTTGKFVVLSIPRDTRTHVEGMGMTKINAANVRGGPAGSARATSELLGGLPIDRYIRINVQGVEKFIDAVGGVTLYVPRDMKYQDDSQHLYINLKQGKQHLNGNQALNFLRYRHDEYGDIGRVQRQQMAIRAFKEQVLNPVTLLRLPQILSTIRENIDTNLSLEELVALAGFVTKIDHKDVQMMMVPGEFGELSAYGGVSYWLPHRQAIDRMMAKFFGQAPVADTGAVRDPRTLRVAIQDNSPSGEGGQAIARALESQGFRGVFRAKKLKEVVKTTRVIAQNADQDGAEQIQALLGVGEVQVDSTGNLESDITIQVGADWQKVLSTMPSLALPATGVKPSKR